MKKTIIFDFNGTMIFDTELHKRAWHAFMPPLIGRRLTEEEFDRNIIGQINAEIFRRYLGDDLTPARLEELANGKEAEYRRQCLLDPSLFRLVDGLPEFLDDLRDGGCTMVIATGSPLCNVEFFREQFALDRWFGAKDIIYDDGSYPGKPDPAIYHKTMAELGVRPQDCVIFEDSLAGVLAAHRAGVECVFALSPTVGADFYAEVGGVTAVLRDYRGYRDFPILP